MKYIRYKMQVSEDAENPVLVDKLLRTYQEDISAILEEVKLEAYNGEYTVEDDGESKPDTTTADDVLNALLGVNRYA